MKQPVRFLVPVMHHGSPRMNKKQTGPGFQTKPGPSRL
jgi:hypothetical protein